MSKTYRLAIWLNLASDIEAIFREAEAHPSTALTLLKRKRYLRLLPAENFATLINGHAFPLEESGKKEYLTFQSKVAKQCPETLFKFDPLKFTQVLGGLKSPKKNHLIKIILQSHQRAGKNRGHELTDLALAGNRDLANTLLTIPDYLTYYEADTRKILMWLIERHNELSYLNEEKFQALLFDDQATRKQLVTLAKTNTALAQQLLENQYFIDKDQDGSLTLEIVQAQLLKKDSVDFLALDSVQDRLNIPERLTQKAKSNPRLARSLISSSSFDHKSDLKAQLIAEQIVADPDNVSLLENQTENTIQKVLENYLSFTQDHNAKISRLQKIARGGARLLKDSLVLPVLKKAGELTGKLCEALNLHPQFLTPFFTPEKTLTDETLPIYNELIKAVLSGTKEEQKRFHQVILDNRDENDPNRSLPLACVMNPFVMEHLHSEVKAKLYVKACRLLKTPEAVANFRKQTDKYKGENITFFGHLSLQSPRTAEALSKALHGDTLDWQKGPTPEEVVKICREHRNIEESSAFFNTFLSNLNLLPIDEIDLETQTLLLDCKPIFDYYVKREKQKIINLLKIDDKGLNKKSLALVKAILTNQPELITQESASILLTRFAGRNRKRFSRIIQHEELLHLFTLDDLSTLAEYHKERENFETFCENSLFPALGKRDDTEDLTKTVNGWLESARTHALVV